MPVHCTHGRAQVLAHLLPLLAQVHEYNVAMSCEGCSNAVNRVLSRQQGRGEGS